MLNPEQVQVLKNEGYSDSEIAEALSEVEREQRLQKGYAGAVNQNTSFTSGQQSPFVYNPNDNMIKWQLELNEILERAEHILREDEIEIVNGKQIWSPTTRTDRILNENGVREIMRILSMYVNRNTVLGNYTDEQVQDKVYDFGDRLNNLIYTKYEIMGMDTADKRKNFEMFWGMLVDIVHSTYSRAIGSGERSSLREARQLQQTEQINPINNTIMAGGVTQKRSIFNPARYFVGKYK